MIIEGTESPLFYICMINKETVENLINERIAGTDIFIVDIHISNTNSIKVRLDADKGLTIRDCVDVSRQVEHNLDREDEDFSLEVTSFGLGENLVLHRQYQKNVGKYVSLHTLEGKHIKGLMKEVSEEVVHIEQELTKKQKKDGVETDIKIPFEEIRETKLQIRFK